MNIVLGVLVVVVVSTLTIAAMLLVRRRAPEGSYFRDGDRASGVFGVLASGFALLLGFMIFLAFESYDDSRSGAEMEATIVAQQVETAQFLPTDVAAKLTGELVCYGRSVAGIEWVALDAGRRADAPNQWGAEMFHTLRSVKPQTATEQSAYDRWMDQTAQREQARVARLHGAQGIMPLPVWFALYLIAGVIVVYMLFFADPGEGAITQSMLMGGATVVITLLILMLMFFDHPHGNGLGALQPTAMERSLRLIDAEMNVAGLHLTPPCDRQGRPV
jgi:amino acid transporter